MENPMIAEMEKRMEREPSAEELEECMTNRFSFRGYVRKRRWGNPKDEILTYTGRLNEDPVVFGQVKFGMLNVYHTDYRFDISSVMYQGMVFPPKTLLIVSITGSTDNGGWDYTCRYEFAFNPEENWKIKDLKGNLVEVHQAIPFASLNLETCILEVV